MKLKALMSVLILALCTGVVLSPVAFADDGSDGQSEQQPDEVDPGDTTDPEPTEPSDPEPETPVTPPVDTTPSFGTVGNGGNADNSYGATNSAEMEKGTGQAATKTEGTAPAARPVTTQNGSTVGAVAAEDTTEVEEFVESTDEVDVPATGNMEESIKATSGPNILALGLVGIATVTILAASLVVWFFGRASKTENN